MVLGIDLRCLPEDGSSGAGIAHAARIVSHLICEYAEDLDVICFLPVGAYFKFVPTVRNVSLPDARRTSLIRALCDHPCDALFIPSGAIPFGVRVPAIPWVHDVDIFSHPEWFPQSWFQRMLTTWMFLRGIKDAPVVFTVSEYTKRELVELVSIPKERIVVTGEGAEPSRAVWDKEKARQLLEAEGVTRPFALMLGTVEPRKNISFITEMWPEITAYVPNLDLVIAGKDGWKTEFINMGIKKAKAIRISAVDEDLKRALLQSAAIVITPSLSEGFGLVPLEAIQARTPALVSDRGALKEVVSDWDWCIPLEDRQQWINQIVTLCLDSVKRGEMVEHQSKAIKKWSWERTAHIILETIRSLSFSSSSNG